MKILSFTLFILMVFAFNLYAFECPARFNAAQAAIDKVTQAMKGQNLPQENKALVHALLDDAKMLLTGAKHNHEKPQGKYDHARAVAKAASAKEYAEAAGLLLSKL